MIFTEWKVIKGFKFGIEVLPSKAKGQNLAVQLDLFLARAVFTYYGQRL